MASKESRHPDKSSASGHGHAGAKSESPGGIPPLHLGILIAALILAAGLVYVFATQAPAANGASPARGTVNGAIGTPVSPATGGASANFTLPKSAEWTGNASCSTGGKTQVLLFTDPYCPACVASDPQVNSFVQKFKNKADIQYRIVSTHSRTLSPIYGIDTVYAAHDYFVCSQEQGKIQEFKRCFYGNLTLQNGEYIPETKAQLQSCAQAVGLDQKRLDACLPGARAKVDAAIRQAAAFGGGTFFTPMAVVDCQVRVNSALVEAAYCAVSKAC